jgi:ABC-type sugar transport system ATPase subunit
MDVRFEAVRFARAGRPVLDVPELTLASGRVTALLGPNGSGKSTLLRLVAALERPSSGRVLLGGRPAAPSRRTRESIAFAFQEPAFLSGSVRQNLDLGLRLRGLPPGERSPRLLEAARAGGIEHLLDRSAHRLSGGEAQRANLVRALSLRAPVTLLDEPLAGLDEPSRHQAMHDLPRLLRSFTTTTILVTHVREEALRLADDLVVLFAGRVRAAGPAASVVRRPPDAETAAFLGYTLLPTDAGLTAIAPGSLRTGPGDVCFRLEVEDVRDLATTLEIAGRIAGVSVTVLADAPAPARDSRIDVSAPADAVIHFE